MGRYHLTGPAKDDIREIVRYIRERNPSASVSVRRELQAAMRRLGDFPGMGHVRDELANESLRVWSVYSYLIVYRPERKPIEVLRVVHGARDLRRAVFGR
jgi:plasmid stabilization system protein ParE